MVALDTNKFRTIEPAAILGRTSSENKQKTMILIQVASEARYTSVKAMGSDKLFKSHLEDWLQQLKQRIKDILSKG